MHRRRYDMKEEAIVTCGYCEQAACWQYDERFLRDAPPFFCETVRGARYYTDPICDRFTLRSGLHTTRWYPGKPEP